MPSKANSGSPIAKATALGRGLLYVGMPRASIDERGFEMARRIREAHGDLSPAEFKAIVRDQFSMLTLDEPAAIAALSDMLPAELETRRAGFKLIREILGASRDLSAEQEKRLAEIARIFRIDAERSVELRPVKGVGRIAS